MHPITHHWSYCGYFSMIRTRCTINCLLCPSSAKSLTKVSFWSKRIPSQLGQFPIRNDELCHISWTVESMSSYFTIEKVVLSAHIAGCTLGFQSWWIHFKNESAVFVFIFMNWGPSNILNFHFFLFLLERISKYARKSCEQRTYDRGHHDRQYRASQSNI